MAIIKETEEKYGLDEQSIKFDTIKSRLFANNLTGICHQKTSPIDEVEPLIVNCCVALGKIGDALTKFEVLELADDILVDTIHADRLVAFCKARKIEKDISKGKIVGARWYTNFMKRHGELIRSKPCRLQDRNRHT
jgi:hypothetical protein